MENPSGIDQQSPFLKAPNPIAFLTRCRHHFGTILDPFWYHCGRSWGPFAFILAVLDPPGALPRDLLSPLGAPGGASGAILDAWVLILDIQTPILKPQVPHFADPEMILPN